MSTPKTGPLGGFGDLVLGAAPEDGDLQLAPAGLVRHYRFHEGAGTTANSDTAAGAFPLVPSPASTASPVFGQPGASFASAKLPSNTGSTRGDSLAAFYDNAASGAWATIAATGCTVEFWIKVNALPEINWNSASTVTSYLEDSNGALIPQSNDCVGYVAELEILSLGDPSVDTREAFPPYVNPTYTDPYLKITAAVATDSVGTPSYALVGEGFALGDYSDMGWHHVKVVLSKSRHFVHSYWDGVLIGDYGGFSKAPSSGAMLRVGGADWGPPNGDGGAPLTFMHAPAGVNGGNSAGTLFAMKKVAGGGSFQIENLAVYNNPTDLGSYSPVYVSATTGFSVGPKAVRAMPVRVTQAGTEVLLAKPSYGRITNEVIEVVRTGDRFGRVTGTYAEVLRSLPVEQFSVSATTGIVFASASTGIRSRSYSVSATTSFGVSSVDTSRIGHQLPVSATTTVNFVATSRGYVPAVYSLSARSDMTVAGSGNGVVHNPQPYFVSASTSIALSAPASMSIARAIRIAATTTVRLSSSCYAPTAFHVSAGTGFFLSGFGNGHTQSVYVSATTGLALSSSSRVARIFGPKFVYASSGFNLTTPARQIANLLLYVSAMTSMTLADLASKLKRGPILVSAATTLGLTHKVTYTNPGPRYVAATTNLSLATTAAYSRSAILMVSATTGLALSSAGSEVASLNVAGRGGFVLTGAGRQNRDILAAAATSLGLSNTPGTNNLKVSAAHTSMTFVSHAGLLVTGTEASSGLVFTDLAQAVVWIPWRRTALTLPAGGNLPHS